ncbi:MAG: tandem-95 repeat protein, partial [Clostridia bacterium]|nr:tandem-95 repeat protein [Clostridia bacterium]
SEDWDDYTTGQDMHGVNGWTGWDNNPGATAYTSASQAVSAPHSIEVAGATDLVQTFDGYDEGLWRFSAQQYVPAGFTGTTYLILLNQYGGPYDWSTQVEFMSASNVVHDDYTGTERPLVRDRWVEIRIEIDLDADWQRLYYDGFLLSEGSWTHGTGITSIGALDLYANGSSAVYYDDLSLAVPAAEDWSEDWDDYATGQDMHGVNGWTGWDNNPGATAFTSTAQSKSAPRSVEIAGAADLVQTFVGYDDGLWRFTAWQYVPTGFTGTTYLILMDQYGDTDSWATQIEFRGDEELVVDDFASTWLPLVRDRWVEIRIEIDLDADWQRVIYDGTLMSEIPWTSYGGITSFGALDLYANNSSAVFYDDLSLTRIVNHAPLAVDDAVSTPEDTPVNIDVLANDTDADGDLLTVSAVTAPLHGSAVIQPDQTVTYTPDPDWSGATDSFIYFIADEAGAASAADVYVTVTAVNDPPVAAPDAYTAAENTLLTVPASGVLGNDTDTEGDPLTAVLTEDALHGTLTLSPDGSFTYLPDADWWGTDVFSYNAHDGGLDSAPVDVTITVMPRSLLTNGGLAAFDMDGTTEGSQFRLIFTPDAAAPRTFRLNASNPGQFSYNLYWPEGGEVDVVIPYPFVTQGAAPVQFYDGAELLETDGGWSLIPGGWVASDAQTVSLDPDGEDSVLTLTFPEGAVFATIHLDYGLKGTQPYEAGGVDHLDAIGETETVRNLSDYGFTADDGTIDDEAVIQNINVFKKIAGIGGLATEGGAPLADVGIVITSPVLPSPVTVRTDADGWYLWNWKHTGKAAEFTVTMQYGTEPFPSQTVTLKSGKYAQADFILP